MTATAGEQLCPHGAIVHDGWTPCTICSAEPGPLVDDPPAALVNGSPVALVDPADVVDAPAPEPEPAAVRLPTLPAELWQARPLLAHIRQAARARMRSADVALLAVLARLASMLAPWLRADAGLGPAQLCLYLAIVGPSGAGKTTGYGVAAELLPAPPHLTTSTEGVAPYVDGIGIGSGEGLAELYMGRRRDDDGTTARGQVRHRALVVVDEGEQLTALGQRRGATAGAVLRAAWSGAALGSAGASSETTRVVAAGAYTLGLVTGWQMGTAQALLDDTDTGMAQRFVWCSATDPTIDEHDVPDWPGPLDVTWTDAMIRGQVTITYPDAVRSELRARHAAIQRGDLVPDPVDTHAPLHRIRLAALFAVLDGRTRVTGDDWELGGIVWRTSCAVRAAVAEHGRRAAERERAERDQQRVTLAERTAAVVDVAPARVERIARRLAVRVADAQGMTRADARRGVKHEERHLYDAAVTVAEVRGWVLVNPSGALLPGEATP
ncbi:hypothetical protein ACU61A_22155 [Pseudonocardia sichuanensis]